MSHNLSNHFSFTGEHETAESWKYAQAVACNVEGQEDDHSLIHFLLIALHFTLDILDVYLIQLV